MERRGLWMALLLGAVLSFGCGDDSGGDDDDSSGESGRGGSSGSRAGVGGGAVPGEGVACGSSRCEMPEGSTAEPCCFDAFSSTCGMQGGLGGGACVSLVETDPRCPMVSTGPIMFAACCTDDNQCGINATAFGEDCVELSVAEQMAMDRINMFNDGDEDGGMSMFPGGFTIDFPDSQACE
jgi:hypothetical protein